jgi:GDPmannose 4,6-dehydratase
MRKALVLGVNGQDGSYLAEGLLRRGYEVTGIGRQQRSRHIGPTDFFHYVIVDLSDASKLDAVLRHDDFDVVFHVAAVHGSSGFSYEPIWRNMMEVNVLALHVLLEHARVRRPDMRIQRYGLDYRDHLREAAPSAERPPDFRVSLNRLKAAVGRAPALHLCTIVDEMLAYSGVPASTIAAAAPVYRFDGTPR